VTRIKYTTREKVQRAPDFKATSRSALSIDGGIGRASDTIDGELHRTFYPHLATHSWDWPNRFSAPWRLWLEEGGGKNLELISVDTLVSGGVAIPSSDYTLYPDDGPPFDRIEILISTSSIFGGGATHQKDITVTGLFGHTDNQVAAGELVAAVATTTEDTIDVTDGSLIGVGSLLSIGTERMNVIGRRMLDTTQNLQGGLADRQNDTLIPVQDGTEFFPDDVLLIDGEKMLVLDIAGNNLLAQRAWDGSVLGDHSLGTDIYASRRLVVERGAVGTTAVTHALSDPITLWEVPPLVEEYATALAIDNILQKTSGYSRVVGGGAKVREETGRGIREIRADAYTTYGRKVRMRAV
jgi:hypothetical protein